MQRKNPASGDACVSREVERKVEGKLQKSMQYYHRLSAVTVVSAAEVACSLALLWDRIAQLGRRFLDIVVPRRENRRPKAPQHCIPDN